MVGHRADIDDGVRLPGGYENFLADGRPEYLATKVHFDFAVDEHKQFIGVVNKVPPGPTRRVRPDIAAVAACSPIVFD